MDLGGRRRDGGEAAARAALSRRRREWRPVRLAKPASMQCPACATETTSPFCPRCGTAVLQQADASAQPPPYPGAPYQGTPYAGPTLAVADDRNWAMGVHLSALIGFVFPFGNILGPLVFWLVRRDRSPLVDFAGKQALNFHITLTIFSIIALVFTFLFIGLPFLIAGIIVELVFTIVAAVKSTIGEMYRVPLSIPFFS